MRPVLVLAAVLAAAPAAAQTRDSADPAPPPRGAHERSDSWFGFTVGSGFGGLRAGAASASFGDVLADFDPWPLAVSLRGGPTLGAHWLAGVDLSLFRLMGSNTVTDYERGGVTYPGRHEISAHLQTTALSAIGQWFPAREGPFLRAGLGVATLQEAYETPAGQDVDDRVSQLGLNGTAGLGWAFWVLTRMNVTVSFDASVQLFPWSDPGERDASHVFVGGVGLDWY